MRVPLVLASILPLFSCAIGITQSSAPSAVQASSLHASPSRSGVSGSKFEVASVKKTDPNQKMMIVNALLTYPGARVVARGATLEYLLMEAYNLPRAQVTGGPSWVRDVRFEIEAKPSADVAARYAHLTTSIKTPPPDEIRQMLRNLLTERFRLKLVVQQQQGPVYALVKSGGPLRLNPPKNSNEFPWAGGVDGQPGEGGLQGMNISMPALAGRMSEWLSKPVIDQTGLAGAYDFEVVVRSGQDEVPSDLGVNDNLFQSLKELGLQLKKTTGPIQTLIIEQASLPIEN